MTPEKVMEVIETYRQLFIERGIGKTDYPHDDFLEPIEVGFDHCHGMLDKMVEFVCEGRMEKVFRWLGLFKVFFGQIEFTHSLISRTTIAQHQKKEGENHE